MGSDTEVNSGPNWRRSVELRSDDSTHGVELTLLNDIPHARANGLDGHRLLLVLEAVQQEVDRDPDHCIYHGAEQLVQPKHVKYADASRRRSIRKRSTLWTKENPKVRTARVPAFSTSIRLPRLAAA